MKLTRRLSLAATALAIAVPTAAAAQDTLNAADTITTSPLSHDDNDRDFPWGLLGLLGLAGLLGRKRGSDVHLNRTDGVNRR